jgi:signal peptidase I
LIISLTLLVIVRNANLGIRVFMIVFQLCIAFAVMQRVFKLSMQRTLVPFGAYVGTIVLQIVLAVVVMKPFVTEAFVMPTRSMAPTLEPGDRFIVNKVISPRRFDLVAFWHVDRPGEKPAVYCKRLIGLPGERVRFDDGMLYINDQRADAPAVVAGRFRMPPHYARYRDGQTISLAKSEFFVIGDNVEISADSRLFGPVAAADMVGVVDLMYWPRSKMHIVR